MLTEAGATIIAAGIGAAGSLGAAGANAGSTRRARRDNYRYGERAADHAVVRQKNIYNALYSPEAMMRQYTDAGLSPNLMYGNGNASGGGNTNAPQGTGTNGVPGADMSGIGSAGQKALDGLLAASQIGLNKANAHKADIESLKSNQLQKFREIKDEQINIANTVYTDARTRIFTNLQDKLVQSGYKSTAEAFNQSKSGGYADMDSYGTSSSNSKSRSKATSQGDGWGVGANAKVGATIGGGGNFNKHQQSSNADSQSDSSSHGENKATSRAKQWAEANGISTSSTEYTYEVDKLINNAFDELDKQQKIRDEKITRANQSYERNIIMYENEYDKITDKRYNKLKRSKGKEPQGK